ncbi:antibiotic biosynthesis monooxygenase family protein [Flagellimonas pacifica]|uniref:Antibiotic biosynthesis monooxygenase n=1 Tax=Flagellimonas pacifica TaxID=1247520 RepID=A0A285MVF6_9FLAO|nr:antibiotic biosynthesis monooxygenase family protein [Allomuricauda parva]SNZ01174.1 Antibiotic biosynthesis monooxygenase [Allomuricauda parva]
MNTKELSKKSLKISKIVFTILFLTGMSSCNNEANQKNKSNMETSNSEHVVLINPFEVPEGKLEESIKYWEACRDFLKKEPGYISTELHQSIKDDAKFELINVAVWESPKAFMEASKKMGKELGVAPTEGLKANPSLYTIIRE